MDRGGRGRQYMSEGVAKGIKKDDRAVGGAGILKTAAG